MSHRATITLEKEAFHFLIAEGKDNRSAYINTLLLREKEAKLREAILKANKEEASDISYQDDLSLWDYSLGDGL